MLLCLSIDHRSADLSVLERIQPHADALRTALADPGLSGGAVVLATCNRFEAYLHAPDSLAPLAIALVAERTGLSQEVLAHCTTVRHGPAVAEHLFAVSGGLESAVVGEGEIAGQVRRALEDAREAGTVSSELERLFQTAARTSREIKHGTGIQSAGRSLVRLALRMAETRIGDWNSARILLIGTGAYSGASLAALRARGAQRVGVFSPSGRAEMFAASHAIAPVAAAELDEVLADTDLVVACSHAREPLLDREQLERTVRKSRPPFCSVPAIADFRNRFPRPRLLIDMGLPRNIDPAAAEVPGIELLDLETVVKHASVPELGAEAEARAIVQLATERFVDAGAENAAAPLIVALREHVNETLRSELARVVSGTGAQDGSAAAIEAALKHFTGRLLHQPTVRLRELARQGRAAEASQALEALFGLGALPGFEAAPAGSGAAPTPPDIAPAAAQRRSGVAFDDEQDAAEGQHVA